MTLLYKYPRLYLNALLAENAQVILGVEHVHYLKNVLRKNAGDYVRVFNGQDGEFLACIVSFSKKEGVLIAQKCLREQLQPRKKFVLYFAPIKKARMDFLIEKAVELGVSAFYPVITARTENRNLNIEKLRLQIIEAAEQCERMDIPELFEPIKLAAALHLKRDVPLYVALERADAQLLSTCNFAGGAAFLIGPEGGFDGAEVKLIQGIEGVRPMSLGDTILRAETAALACLSYAKLSTEAVE